MACGGPSEAPVERGTIETPEEEASPVAEAPAEPLPIDAEALAEARRLLARFTWGAKPGELRAAALDLDAARASLLVAESSPADLDERFPIDEPAAVLAQRFTRVPERSESMDDDDAMETSGSRRDLLRLQQERALVLAIEGSGSFRALLTDFWFNHFNVHALKGTVAYSLLDYENTLREQSVGSFETMLLSVARHPAMLEYLDNATSVREGFRDGRGLNENYARELLELHTLGEGNGYTQRDVRETARIFTGWNMRRQEGAPKFVFRRRAHDAEVKSVMGQRYGQAQSGVDEGEALLRRLAADPRTATRISEALAERFLGPAASSAELLETYDAQNLQPLITRLLATESMEPLFKTPAEFVISACRFVGGHVGDPRPLRQALGRMQMLPYNQPIPTGYPPGEAWLSTSTMLERFRFARALVHGEAGVEFDLDKTAPPVADAEAAVAWAEMHLGQVSSNTREVIASLADDESRTERLLALIASPEFMVR